MNRKEFISIFSNKERKEEKIRPPFWSDNSLYKDICPSCSGHCVFSCNQNIIYKNKDEAPYLSFSSNGCTYCEDCVDACPSEIIQHEHQQNIQALIYIDDKICLGHNKTMCFSCKEPCIDNAIDFQGMFEPKINQNCTSCGFCISKCPVDAIKIIKTKG